VKQEILQTVVLMFSIIGGILSLIVGIVLHKKLALFVASSFIMFVGLIVVIGYMFNSPSIYTYPSGKIGVALPSGICFLITGFCLFLLTNEMEFKNKNTFFSNKKKSL
jgi:uncharacterized membrane protein